MHTSTMRVCPFCAARYSGVVSPRRRAFTSAPHSCRESSDAVRRRRRRRRRGNGIMNTQTQPQTQPQTHTDRHTHTHTHRQTDTQTHRQTDRGGYRGASLQPPKIHLLKSLRPSTSPPWASLATRNKGGGEELAASKS